LTYEEREIEDKPAVDDGKKRTEMELGLETLVTKHGLKTVKDALSRITKS
jgi:hypothetical protein